VTRISRLTLPFDEAQKQRSVLVEIKISIVLNRIASPHRRTGREVSQGFPNFYAKLGVLCGEANIQKYTLHISASFSITT
jgi:hypothetical protein